MSKVSQYELRHAVRYATEATRLFMFRRLSADLPFVFRHARIDVRPADSKTDYFVPAIDPQHAVVVVRTWFERDGCDQVACFPFQEGLEPCRADQSERLVRLGSGSTMACQEACRWSPIDTEYRNSKCWMVNVRKKQLALAPEEMYGMASKHEFHSGLDLVGGRLQLNAQYCGAYGLDFSDGDCYESTGQKIAEIFIGSNVYRSIKRALNPPTPPPRRRIRRAAPPQQQPTEDPTDDTKQLVYDLALELSLDVGVDVSLDFVAHVLRKKIPGLVVKAVVDLPIKCAMLQAVTNSYAAAMLTGVRAMGTAVKVASTALMGYGIVSLVLDAFDPYEFNKVLTKRTLQEIDLALDQEYFDRASGFEIEVTPEFLWDYVLADEDESERFLFFADRVREYLNALKLVPPPEPLKTLPTPPAKEMTRTGTVQWLCVFAVVVVAFLVPRWIQYWAILIFFIMLLTKP